MPTDDLIRQYERARGVHVDAVRDLVPLLAQMALESVADALPGGAELDVLGEINEDWLPILRIQRVLDAGGQVLFDVETGTDDQTVETMIDEVNIEYLDLLLDLTGDDFMGAKPLGSEWT